LRFSIYSDTLKITGLVELNKGASLKKSMLFWHTGKLRILYGQKHLLLPAFTCFYLLYLAFLIIWEAQKMSLKAILGPKMIKAGLNFMLCA